MKIGGLMKLTLLDFPQKIACTVFTVGCNFRCPFCHNSGMVFGTNCENLSEQDVFDFLNKRKSVLEGVCLTGGEPLLQSGVEDFLRHAKQLGYATKLDTNGSFPEKLEELINQKLVDYVAMDVKNCQDCYHKTAGVNVDVAAIDRSVQLLKSGVVDYEFRTTVTTDHTEETMHKLGQWLQGAKRLYLQKFVAGPDMIDPSSQGHDDETMKKFRTILQTYVAETHLRGMEE